MSPSAWLLALCLATTFLLATSIQDQSQLVLRGTNSETLGDDAYGTMRRRMTAQFGQGAGSDWVDAMKEFDAALEEAKAKAGDARSKAALEAAKKKYDENVASWSKMRNELGTSTKVQIDALSASTKGLKASAAAIKRGEPVGAISTVLEAIGGISMAIPGGQAAGLVFCLIGTIVGMFTPVASPSRPLTLQDIEVAVKSIVREELKNFQADSSRLSILTRCNEIKADISTIYIDLNHYVSQTWDTQAKKATLRSAIKKGIEQIKTQIRNVVRLYTNIDTSISQNAIVDTNRAAASCSDACALMTVPYDRWIQNPAAPKYDMVHSMHDNYRNGRSLSKTAYWYPCPAAEGGKIHEHEMRDAAFKGCILHDTKWWGGQHNPYCRLEPGCYGRVSRLNDCRSGLEKSNRLFKGLSETLQCASDRAIALQSLVGTITAIGQINDNFPGLDEDFNTLVRNLDAQMQQVTFYLAYRNPIHATKFSFDGGKNTYDCFDPRRSWVEAYGYETFTGKAPYDDYRTNAYLTRGPCTTENYLKQYCEVGSGGWTGKCRGAYSAWADRRVRCSEIQGNGENPKWDQINPFYDYEALTEAQWVDSFKLP